MKVLLKEDVDHLGSVGDLCEVKDGFGRNYLLPKGKAILATPRNLKQFKHQKSIVESKVKKVINSAQAVADEIAKINCKVSKKVGDQGKLYGAVTTQEIADILKENGVEVDKRKIQLEEPLKTLGEFKIPIKLHSQVTAEINVAVVQAEE